MWDFLKPRYTAKDLAHQYQFLTALHAKTRQPYQSIDSFQLELYVIWDQLALSEPVWDSPTDAAKFETY